MSGYSNENHMFQLSKKLVKANPLKYSGLHRKKEIYVGNLPLDMTEEEIAALFEKFGILSMKRHSGSFKNYAFLEMVSPEAAQLAIQLLNGHPVKRRLITVAFSENRRGHELPKTSAQMPALEVIPHKGFPPPDGGAVSPPVNQRVCYAVPMEMRSSFLLHVLNDCFGDAKWFLSVANVAGEVGLLVTDTFPLTPYFWAIPLSEEHHQTMRKLFAALAKAESQLPFLAKQDVRRGTRCLAECNIGEEGSAWNRCWVLDTMEEVAVVFFVDFGSCANIPLNSLRNLEGGEFWEIGPLAQPFVLEEEVFHPQVIRRQILEGKVKGPFQWEPHVLKFVLKAE